MNSCGDYEKYVVVITVSGSRIQKNEYKFTKDEYEISDFFYNLSTIMTHLDTCYQRYLNNQKMAIQDLEYYIDKYIIKSDIAKSIKYKGETFDNIKELYDIMVEDEFLCYYHGIPTFDRINSIVEEIKGKGDPKVITIESLEKDMRKLKDQIRILSKLVNRLDYKSIPDINNEIEYIKSHLRSIK